MSWDINHVVVVGRLTKDPELTYTQSGKAICRFSVAVNRSSSSSDSDNANFFNVVAWNKTAELCNEYLKKGRQVGIDGRLQQRKWEAQDGGRRSIVEIVANNVQFFGGPSRGGYGDSRQPAGAEQDFKPAAQPGEGRRAPQQQDEGRVQETGEGDPFLSELDDDEIPF